MIHKIRLGILDVQPVMYSIDLDDDTVILQYDEFVNIPLRLQGVLMTVDDQRYIVNDVRAVWELDGTTTVYAEIAEGDEA